MPKESARLKDETQLAFLKDEYLLLQRFYEDFDGRAVTIKGWSATIGLAAIGGGFYQSHHLWAFAAGSALIFWTLEALWKGFQYMYGGRIAAIERAFRDDDFTDLPPFQIYSSWFDAYQAHGLGIWSNFRMSIVMFPHVITFGAGLVLYVLHLAGIIPDLRKP